MKKMVASLLLATGACVSGCIGPGLSGEMSREEAIRLYNGGIPEAAWLEQLDTISRNLPMPDTKSVQLADGFLFYRTDLIDGEAHVVDVVPPADAPDSLKDLAKSLSKAAPEPVVLIFDGKTLFLGDVPVDEEDLRALAEKTANTPGIRQAEVKISVKANVLASDLSKMLSALSETGICNVSVEIDEPEPESANF